MPKMQDYSDHATVIKEIKKVQDEEQEQRKAVKEAKRFYTDEDGHWDDQATKQMDGRFRGQFDMCTPIVEGITGEISQSDFTIRVAPSGGDASMDTASTLDGLIRNIRNISNAEAVFDRVTLSMVVGGFDAFEIVQDWIDSDTFDQDLMIKYVPNAVDSVWFDGSSIEPSRCDANWGIKYVALSPEEYKSRWPEGSESSLDDNSESNSSNNCLTSKEVINVGKLYYRKPRNIDLVMMTDGKVYRDDDKFTSVADELAQQGIIIATDAEGNEKRRVRKSWRVYSRMLDNDGWLDKEEETVFDYIPLIPMYGNFDILDNVTRYSGKLNNIFDQQRVLNYAISRDIEDGALSPSPTIWMTDKMAEGNDYSNMNTDRAPVRIFNVDEQMPMVPQLSGGPVASTGLQTTIQNMQQMINTSSNVFSAQQGNANAQQSGIAGMQQIEQGNVGNIKWSKAKEVALCHAGKVLINAIPRVYDATRQARTLSEDGTSKMVMLNQPILDQETNQNVVLNDLSIGEYDVVCEVGPAFNSAQKESARSFEAMMSVDPSISAIGSDVWLKNKKEPGMELVAERLRTIKFNEGVIPESQWTDEEKQQVQEQQQAAQNQPPQEDPNMIFARAEEGKAQAELMNAQNKQSEIQGDQQLKMKELELRDQEIQLDVAKFQRGQDDKFNVDAAKIDQGQQKLELEQQKIDLQEQKQDMDARLKQMELQQKEGMAEFDRRVAALGKAQSTTPTPE